MFATIPLILGVLPGRVRPPGVARRRGADPRRQHGLGRTRGGPAGGRRVVPLPARKLRPVALGPADGVPVRLADPHQRAARGRLRARRPPPSSRPPSTPAYKEFDEAHTAPRSEIDDRPTTRDGRHGRRPVAGLRVRCSGVLILALLYRRVTALGQLSVVFLLGVLAVLGVGAGRRGDALRPGPRVRHDADRRRAAGQLRPRPSGSGWGSRSTRTSATTTCATWAARCATRPGPSRARSSLSALVGRRAVHPGAPGHHRRRAVAGGGPGKGQPDGRVHARVHGPVGRGAGDRVPRRELLRVGVLGAARATRGCRTRRRRRGTSSAGSRRSTRGTHIPHRALSAHRGDGPVLELLQPGHDHQGADRHADPGAVRRPGVRRDPAAAAATGPPAAVADVALPAAVRGRAGRLAVRVRHRSAGCSSPSGRARCWPGWSCSWSGRSAAGEWPFGGNAPREAA